MAKTLSVNFNQMMGESRQVNDIDRGDTPKSLYSCINFEPDLREGKLQVSKGFSLVCSLGTGQPVQNMTINKDNNALTRFIALSSGNVYEVTNWTTTASKYKIDTGLKTSGFIDIVPSTKRIDLPYSIDNFLVFLDGENYPQKFDYTSLSDLTTSHIASFGYFLNDRLWTNSITEPALVKWSKAYLIDDFTGVDDAGFKQLGDNSNPITAMTSLFMPASNISNIFVAKKDELWGVSGTQANDFQQFKISTGETGVGTQSPKGLLSIKGELVILEDNLPKRYSTVITQTGILRPNDIALPIKDIWDEDVNKSALENGFVFFTANEGMNGRVYSFVPNVISNCNEAFVYDVVGAWFRRKFFAYSFTCYAVDPDTHDVYLGDSFGNIYKFNDGYSYNGESYSCFADFGWVDFGVGGVQKTGTAYSYIENDIYADTDFTLNIIKRGRNGNLTEQTNKTFNLKRQGFEYGLATYGEAFYTEKTTLKSYFSSGTFDTMKIQLSYTNENDSNFTINSMLLMADPGMMI